MISAVQFNERIASASIHSGIIGKLRFKKKLYSIILLKIDKNSKIEFSIVLFCLSI